MTTQTVRRRRRSPTAIAAQAGIYVILIGIAILVLIPMFWVYATAFKNRIEIAATPLAWPKEPTLQNFVDAWVKGRLGKYFLNSVIVTIPIVAFTVSFASLAGYAFARHTFAGRNAIFYLFLVGLILPFQSIMIPLYYTLLNFGLLGTYWAMIVPSTAL